MNFGLFFLSWSQNIVLAGGGTIFKDFYKRLQNSVKKIVDDRIAANTARLGLDVKVSLTLLTFINLQISFLSVYCSLILIGT